MIEKNTLYPLKFSPIFKTKIWGGDKLNTILRKEIPTTKTGESWEISDVDGSLSVVKNGPFKGCTLRELICVHKEQLVGKKVYARFKNCFPLLIKFIDAKEDLSVQLHPDDVLAKKRHNSFGKTEMWYVMQADEDAQLILDFKEKISQETYLEHLRQKKLQQILNKENVKKDDVFLINPGLVHAIGGGVLLAEIQQTSDITYRVYDWDRRDTDGQLRELHTELAMEAIDLNKSNDYRVSYAKKKDDVVRLVENTYFKTNFIQVDQKVQRRYQTQDSFVVLMCVKGEVKLSTEMGESSLQRGETILLPACCDSLILEGKAELLEVGI